MVYVATGNGQAGETLHNSGTQAIYALHDTPGRVATIHEDELDDAVAIREVAAHGQSLRIAAVECEYARRCRGGALYEATTPCID